ncbi:universal stress protein [Geodermatophilus sp. SYSU D01186]
MGDRRHRSRIVVGVDGSPSSRQALRWAARQAELTGAELHAVTAWRLPTTYGWIPPIADHDWAGEARAVQAHAIAETLDGTQAERVRRDVVEGHPARALVRCAAGADLLVVGSRGHGGFSGMVLGSVAQHVVTQAPCPVLVVRETAAAEDAPRAGVAATAGRTPS